MPKITPPESTTDPVSETAASVKLLPLLLLLVLVSTVICVVKDPVVDKDNDGESLMVVESSDEDCVSVGNVIVSLVVVDVVDVIVGHDLTWQ